MHSEDVVFLEKNYRNSKIYYWDESMQLWMTNKNKSYPMKILVAFFMGDTPEHDTLMSLET